MMAGEKIKGRKRHLLVDTLGLLLVVLITSAGLDDGVAAPTCSGRSPPRISASRTIFADQKYHNHALETWMAEHRGGWRIEVRPSRRHERLLAVGETLGDRADERLAWPISQEQ